MVAHIHQQLKSAGFRKRKHLFNRATPADLVHVIEAVATESNHVRLQVGVFSHRLAALLDPDGTERAWIAFEHCHFRDPLSLRDPDDADGRGYHAAFAGRVLMERLTSQVIPFLDNLQDMSDLVGVVPRDSIWGYELEARPLIRLLAERGDTLRAQALLQREYAASGPERRVELRALAASLPQIAFEASDEVETDESFLAEWAEAELEHGTELRRLVSDAPDAIPRGRFPEVLAKPRYQVRPEGMLDGTRESLDELWRWVLAIHPQLTHHVSDPTPMESRYRFPSVLTTAELWLAELLSVYVAQVLRRRTPHLRWALDDNAHLGLAGNGTFFDLLDRICLAVLWVKQPPLEQAEHLRIEDLNQLEDVMVLAEAELA